MLGKWHSCRWLAVSSLPDVYEACRTDPKRKFPESPTFNFFWSAVEDPLLDAWLRFVLERPVNHVRLHYDGLRLEADLCGTIEDLCALSSERIAKETGYVVRIRQKIRRYFSELVGKQATKVLPLSLHEVLLQVTALWQQLATVYPTQRSSSHK